MGLYIVNNEESNKMKKFLNIVLILQLILLSYGCCTCCDCAKKSPSQENGEPQEQSVEPEKTE